MTRKQESPQISSREFRTPARNNVADTWTLVAAADRGYELSRKMRRPERIALAVAGCAPSHLITFDSTYDDRDDFMEAWRRLVRRIERWQKGPWIYVATVARSDGQAGYHAHVLAWSYLRIEVLGRHARESGLGPQPDIQMIAQPVSDEAQITELLDFQNALDTTVYVLGQHDPIFGSTDHVRHQQLPAGSRRWLLPHRSTLKARHPELLDALDVAQDRSASDDDLVSSLPVFSRYRKPGTGKPATPSKLTPRRVGGVQDAIKVTGKNVHATSGQAKSASATCREVDFSKVSEKPP